MIDDDINSALELVNERLPKCAIRKISFKNNREASGVIELTFETGEVVGILTNQVLGFVVG